MCLGWSWSALKVTNQSHTFRLFLRQICAPWISWLHSSGASFNFMKSHCVCWLWAVTLILAQVCFRMWVWWPGVCLQRGQAKMNCEVCLLWFSSRIKWLLKVSGNTESSLFSAVSLSALRILVSPGVSEYKVETLLLLYFVTPRGSQVLVSVRAFTLMHQCEFL